MKKNLSSTVKTLSSIFLMNLVSSTSYATPVLGKQCAAQIRAPELGTGVHFSEDCKTAYVLPPIVGQARISAIGGNTSLNFCPSVMRAVKIIENNMKLLEILSDRHLSVANAMNPVSIQLEELEKKIIQIQKKIDEINLATKEDVEKRNQLEGMLEDARSSVSECEETTRDPIEDCKTEHEEFEKIGKQLREIRLKLRPAMSQLADLQRQLQPLVEQKSEMELDHKEVIEELKTIRTEMKDLKTEALNEYNAFAKYEGITGQITYTVEWQKLINEYQRLNGHLNMTWRHMPVKSAKLYAFTKTRHEGNVLDSSFSSLMWAEVPGMSQSGSRTDPSLANSAIDVNSTVASTVDQAPSLGGMLNSVSGSIGLNLLGACPYFPNGVVDRPVLNFNDLTAHLIMNAQFKYELKTKRSYVAKYHFANLISRIEEKVEQGGILSSLNTHKILMESDSSDWFDVQFNADSGEFGHTAEEQKTIVTELKLAAVKDVLDRTAVITNLTATPPPLPATTPTGVGKLATELSANDACKLSTDCLAAALALTVVDTAFGKKTALSELKRANNIWKEERVNGVSFVDREILMTFERPNRLRFLFND